MAFKLLVSQTVIHRLSNVKEKCLCNLYGVLYNNTLIIISLYVQEKVDVINGLPTEVDLYGVAEIGDEVINEDRIKQIVGDIDVIDTPVYINCKLNDVGLNNIEAYFNVHEKLEAASFDTITEAEIYSQFIHIRLNTYLPFNSVFTVDSIRENFQTLRKHLANGQVVFNFPKSNIYLIGTDIENGLVGLTGDPLVGELCKESACLGEGCVGNPKKKKESRLDVLHVTMLKKITRDVTVDNVKTHSPIVYIDKKPHQMLMFSVNIDAIIMVHRNAKVLGLYEKLIEGCCRYLRLLEGHVTLNCERCDGDYSKISEPETFHFFSEHCGHFITRIYPKNANEENLETSRLSLHKRLLIPTKQPMFRRANRYIFKGDVQGSGLLINPHEGVTPTANGGKIVITRGKYSYYHYCQNNMDDDGWGCAYRSLQTLASWFCWQGYTDKQVPTYNEIQKCLVDIGDKPLNFIGSKQWIGSTEVGFVLNSLMDVTSKFIHVSSGDDMGTKGPELVNHFKTQGSPVMIGGGVLAHTIVGVDYNDVTGDVKFLILDPHYTGSEDLAVIQKKGWCSWKGVDFWNKTAYYNMCLPQVPHCI